jgi:lambda family phage portal protein
MQTGLVHRVGKYLFGYDAVESKNRRQAPTGRLRSEDKELLPHQRRKLTSASRDIHRNFTIAAWAIRKHLDYVSTFSFQSRTGSADLDGRIEDLMDWWSRPSNCDVAARHSFPRLVRLAEERRTVDGDVFFLKLSDGRLQAIEGDRVQTPTSGLPDGVLPMQLVHGVQVDEAGQARAYAVCRRPLNGADFAFERLIPAPYVVHHAFFDRFDQVRGISPLAAAINTLRDTYEGFDYALAKAKVAQMFALAFYREAVEPVGEVTGEDADGDGTPEKDYQVDFGRGPVLLDLEPGDRAEFLESKSPSTEFQAFTQTMIQTALKGLDIPYSFFDEAHTNYSGARQALLQYEQSADVKRADVRLMLNNLTAWRLRLFIADGLLELPRGVALANLRWEWIAKGIPWIDPLKEVNADIAAIGAGLASRTDVLKQQGKDFFDVADQLAAENQYLESLGLPTNVAAANAQIVEITNG